MTPKNTEKKLLVANDPDASDVGQSIFKFWLRSRPKDTHPSHEDRWQALADSCYPPCDYPGMPVEECCTSELKQVERRRGSEPDLEVHGGIGLRHLFPSIANSEEDNHLTVRAAASRP